MSAPLSPPAQAVMAAISHLNREEKKVVAGLLQKDIEDDFPEWEMDIVNERFRLLDEGKTQALPLEQVLSSLDAKWKYKS